MVNRAREGPGSSLGRDSEGLWQECRQGPRGCASGSNYTTHLELGYFKDTVEPVMLRITSVEPLEDSIVMSVTMLEKPMGPKADPDSR